LEEVRTQDVLVTKAIRDADGWTDHRLLISQMRLRLQPRQRPQGKRPPGKLNTLLKWRTCMLQVITPPWRHDGVNCEMSSSPPPSKSSGAHAVNTRTGLTTMTPTSATNSRRRMGYTKLTWTFGLTPPKQPSSDAAALYSNGCERCRTPG
uniref:Endo/exonuclease/phosphatase domain-containing protein n=1 Tax=Schistocephalus solidus TaxID=70667 RepID=A0A183T9W6_SCHSO